MLYVIYSLSQSNIFGSSTQNRMLWHSKEDLQFFRKKTMKVKNPNKINAIIMGRTTADSLPNALPGRMNIVITSKNEYRQGFVIYNNLNTAIDECFKDSNVENIFIIGGKQLIEETLKNYIPRRVYINKLFLNNEENIIEKTENLIYMNPIESYGYTLYKSEINDTIYIEYTKYKKIGGDISDNEKNYEERNYLNLLKDIYINGDFRETRNGYTYSLFGKSLEFNLSESFPLLTTKKMFLRGIFEELKFFILGQTDTKMLSEKGVRIWEGNTSRSFLDSMGFYDYEEGQMGKMYGYQWRNFNDENVDQLQNLINELKTNPTSRRLLMTTFNPAQSHLGVLYPCHGIVTQFYVNKKKQLSCIMHQRSADTFLGVPFNIASYALLIHIICMLTKLNPGKLIMNFGDVHIYDSHIRQVLIQINRDCYDFPQLKIDYTLESLEDIKNLEFSHLNFTTPYISHPPIKAEMMA